MEGAVEIETNEKTPNSGGQVEAVVMPAFDYTSLTAGDLVSTPYGIGKVIDYRGIKEVKFTDGSGCNLHEATAKVYLAKKHTGMRVDHSGILGRIAGGCKVRDDQRWCLGELDKHLEEMAERFYSGDIAAVDEFLQLWCLDDKRPEA